MVLKKARRKAAVKTAIETEQSKERSELLERLSFLIEGIKKLPSEYKSLLLKHLRDEKTITFISQVGDGMFKYEDITGFCKKNELKLDNDIKEKVEETMTIFKDDIVFVMKAMKNFDREHKKEICEKYISQVKHGYKKVENGIKEIEAKVKIKLIEN